VSRHHRIMSPNVCGWQDILPRNPPEPRGSKNLHDVAMASGKTPPVMADRRLSFLNNRFRGRCFRCLARDHKVASCHDLPRCLRYSCSGHFSKHCPGRRRPNNHRPDMWHSSPAHRSVHKWLPDEFPPLVATPLRQHGHVSQHLSKADNSQVQCYNDALNISSCRPPGMWCECERNYTP
jgi:hypothetical protein